MHIHFIGIGGAGLSALAHVMLGRGFVVSGSDPAAPNEATDSLEKLGARIFSGHDAQNIAGADLIVATSAAPSDNPELVAAHDQRIPVLKRREFLREVTRGYDVIAVAGSHGKTTTTAMIATILENAGSDPTVVIGGTVPSWNANARVGKSNWFVMEADEYDYAFLGVEPKIAVLTNVDYDHPDLFPTREMYQNVFAEFLKQTRDDGVVVVCGDERAATRVAKASGKTMLCYGFDAENDWRAVNVYANEWGGNDFEIFFENAFAVSASLQVPGQHNVLNALAALIAANVANVKRETSIATLEKFSGVGRRFEIHGSFNGATLVDDYAHHPTEIRATLRAARQRFADARLVVLFQPHTFSRTRALLDEFVNAFEDADEILITEIYAARETDDSGLSSRELVEQMNKRARYVETLEEAEKMLRAELRAGDVLLALGAGDVNQVTAELVGNEYA